MADFLSQTDRFVYLRVKLPRDLYASFIRKFGGTAYALRELRMQWESALTLLDYSADDRSSGSAPDQTRPADATQYEDRPSRFR